MRKRALFIEGKNGGSLARWAPYVTEVAPPLRGVVSVFLPEWAVSPASFFHAPALLVATQDSARPRLIRPATPALRRSDGGGWSGHHQRTAHDTPVRSGAPRFVFSCAR